MNVYLEFIKNVGYGGRGEIRTLGRFASTQPFQGCTIGHSDTRPWNKSVIVPKKAYLSQNIEKHL